MANFYDDKRLDLNELLNLASNEQEGATLLIPDLQRPYIWDPSQVVLLVDSLIRGWPFGTFLTWQIKSNDPVRKLARAFWKLIDRTDEFKNEKVSERHSPGSFRMVLDGQQRIQSLLLAMSGDSWGFKLSDAKWREVLSEEKKRTRQDSQHWSLGCLCVDLETLQKEWDLNKKILLLDFTIILKWVVTGGAKALSETNRKKDYPVPLQNTDKPENIGRYIRLSSFWSAAPLNESVEQDQKETIATDLLNRNNVTKERIAAIIRPVVSLLDNIGRVKRTQVTFL